MFSDTEKIERGNATVAALFNGSPAPAPAPADTQIWKAVTGENNGLNVQPSTSGACAVTMLGQTTSNTFSSTPLGSADLTRNYLVTEARSGIYLSNLAPDAGFQITRPTKTGETADRTNGEIEVQAGSVGNLSLALDGWIDTRNSVPAYGHVQNIRLRLSTPETITNFRMLIRADDRATLREDTTSMMNWNGWWAPGYTQAPSSGFQISYPEINGVKYIQIAAASIPANTWATAQFQADVRTAEITTDARFNSYSAATASFPYHCSAPKPSFTPGAPHRNEASVAVRKTNLDPMPAGTTYGLPDGYTPETGWVIAVNPAIGDVTAKPPVNALPGTHIDVPVQAIFNNAVLSTGDADFTVRAEDAPDNVKFFPTYGHTDAPREEDTPVASPANRSGGDFPAGTTFAVERDSPKWLKSINSADGSAVVNPGHLVLAGDYTVQVRVTFPDTTTEIVPMTVTVPPFPQREVFQPAYSPVSVVQGGTISAPAPKDAPEGTTYGRGAGVFDDLILETDGSGKLTANMDPGDYEIPVRVRYPDGSLETIYITVTVTEEPGLSSNDQCLAAGLPLLLLIPVGLATELNISGLSPIIDEIERQAAQVNAQLQQQAGIYNPEVARFVEQYNDEIRAAALVAAGLLVVSYLAASCSPDGSSTSSTSSDLSSTSSDDGLSSLSSLSSE
ncbi:Rib/alpha-like domain-containing protein [Corynebacterium doosanense]|uniref:Long Rib domain-containing protein n=1 Tax=Corynebacterium doosanense CAU 212 = DSM 45436 TaxID=558173 RepID=A0A097IJK7_9CORY|nr:Rib/alpha-like domain-containing protein [Corynebacterium doosanense]AIT62342.1 hypothetical protein CDOO_12050 [Corynebacterium doosanense CAU 212 = DSM 45436]